MFTSFSSSPSTVKLFTFLRGPIRTASRWLVSGAKIAKFPLHRPQSCTGSETNWRLSKVLVRVEFLLLNRFGTGRDFNCRVGRADSQNEHLPA